MKEQARRTVTLESYRDLETSCRLWMAACQARDERIQELERECHTLQQRVARLSRQPERQRSLSRSRKLIRFAR